MSTTTIQALFDSGINVSDSRKNITHIIKVKPVGTWYHNAKVITLMMQSTSSETRKILLVYQDGSQAMVSPDSTVSN